jgi:hypothetical protein
MHLLPNKTNNYNPVLDLLQDYMLTNKYLENMFQEIKIENLKNFINTEEKIDFTKPKQKSVPKDLCLSNIESKDSTKLKESIISKEVITEKITKKESRFFYPREKDSLFWCYYIIKNGFSAYEYPGVRTFINEKEEKFKCIDLLRKHKQDLKSKKIKNIKEDVEDELGNKERISMKTFIALCIANNINVLFIHKRKCFDLCCDKEEKYHIVHWQDKPNNKYFFEINVTNEIVDDYKKKYFNWESVDKPLKAISYYKSEELIELCKKMNLEFSEKKTKKEMYELLIMNL